VPNQAAAAAAAAAVFHFGAENQKQKLNFKNFKF
jgi:hypothetical protein